MSERDRIFVSTAWLADHLTDPKVVVVDGSWYLPAHKRDAEAEYAAGHIPGAVRFDIDTVKDPGSTLPHMLPTPEAFAAAVGAMGIGDGMTIVVYDGAGLFAAPRVRWTFRVMGAPDVRILEGGLPKWKAEGRPVDAKPVKRAAATFTPRLDARAVVDIEEVHAILNERSAQVVDARAGDRFRGEVPEARPGVRSGRMPGSLNLPATELVAGGTLKDADALAAAFAEANVDLDSEVVTSCGSGVTASIVHLAAETIGAKKLRLYDGSWSEWGARTDKPIATGPTD